MRLVESPLMEVLGDGVHAAGGGGTYSRGF